MGAIYLARDGSLANSLCAVKQMLDLGAESADYLRLKFDSEMRSLVQLQHPGIPRVRDFFIDDQSVFIVMDFIDGQNLEDEQAQLPGNVMSSSQAVQVALEVLDVLCYMHSRTPAILHRDIKPANLIRETGTDKIRVVDFGLARSNEGHSPQTSVGTPGFCAPEQIQGQAVEASDIYAVGVTLHTLVTGLVPSFRLLAKLEEAMPSYDSELATIIEKATAARLEDRYQSAREMQSALRQWTSESGIDKVVSPTSAQPLHPSAAAHTSLIRSERLKSKSSNFKGMIVVSICVGVLVFGLVQLPHLIPVPKPIRTMAQKAEEIPDVGIEGPIFSARSDGDQRLVTLGEDLGLMWVGAAGGMTAEQRSGEIVNRLNGWYHYRCGSCGSLLLEPDGIVIGKVGEETVLFYAHWHGDSYAVPPFLIATIDSKLAGQLGAASPKFLAAHWRDLMRDVVGLSRGLTATHSPLGTQMAPVLQKLRTLPPGNTLSSNLKLILSELTGDQTKTLRDAFKTISPDSKVKPDLFPKHPKFVPLTG
jgi:serine/threonine protein kinase